MANLKIEYLPPQDLQLDEGNPRTISENALKKLQRSINDFGFVEPVVARRHDKKVIGGHQRIAAALANGDASVPVVFLDDIDDDKARLLNVALNNRNLQGEFDDAALAAYLRDVEADLEMSGFGKRELDSLLNQEAVSYENDTIAESWQVVCECDNEKQQQELHDRLTAEGVKCRLLIL